MHIPVETTSTEHERQVYARKTFIEPKRKAYAHQTTLFSK
jgi:hypothetical protein